MDDKFYNGPNNIDTFAITVGGGLRGKRRKALIARECVSRKPSR